MPRKFQNVRQNFAAGVVSPRMSTQVDTEVFNSAARHGDNFIVSPQGGAMYREGMEYVSLLLASEPSRLFQFHRGGDVADILIEVSAGITRYWLENPDTGDLVPIADVDTLLTDESDGFLLTDEDDGFNLSTGAIVAENPYSVEDLPDIYFTNQDVFGVLCHERHPPQYITVRRNGEIVTEAFPKERIPFWLYTDINTPSLIAGVGGWQITFPDLWTDKSYIYYMTFNGVVASSSSGPVAFPFSDTPATNVTNIEDMLNQSATQQGLATTFVVTSVDDLTYTIDITGDRAGALINAYQLSGWNPSGPTTGGILAERTDPANNDATEEPAWSYPTWVFHVPTARYYQCIQAHVSDTASEPGTGNDWETFWIDVGLNPPTGFDYQYPNGNDWAAATKYAPAGRGFPTVCAFHDQRLHLMANKDNPTAIYGSRIGNYFDFIPNVNDDDPFIFVLDSSDTPKIKWARSLRNLILGTSSGEWLIGADVTITPTDIRAVQQNNVRSDLSIPVQINTEIVYIEQGNRKLRTTQYQRSQDSFTSSDMTTLAEHLTRQNRVERIVSGYTPDVFAMMTRENGQPLFMAYDAVTQVLAYTPCVTEGDILDVCGYYSLQSNQDWTYVVAKRGNVYSIERMRYPQEPEEGQLLEEQGKVHLDAWVSGDIDGVVIEGLDHLEGKKVDVLVDDAWQIGEFVVTGGRVTLPETRTGRYVVGLPYQGLLETFEIADNFQGTGLGTKRRWAELNSRLLNSALPIVESARAADRKPSTPMNTAETVVYGLRDVRQSVSGYNDGAIRVVVDRPYPCHVLGFFGHYQVEDR